MAVNDHLPNDDKVMQVGLWETSNAGVEILAKRVAKFNQRRMSNIILDIEPHEKGDPRLNIPGPHYKLRLTFPNHQVQEAFWLE